MSVVIPRFPITSRRFSRFIRRYLTKFFWAYIGFKNFNLRLPVVHLDVYVLVLSSLLPAAHPHLHQLPVYPRSLPPSLFCDCATEPGVPVPVVLASTDLGEVFEQKETSV